MSEFSLVWELHQRATNLLDCVICDTKNVKKNSKFIKKLKVTVLYSLISLKLSDLLGFQLEKLRNHLLFLRDTPNFNYY